jgi:pyrroline-5-carboxylate reductase
VTGLSGCMAPAPLSGLTFRAEQVVISVMAGIRLDALHALVAPAHDLVRAIPLPAVATRTGLTDFATVAEEYATPGGLNEQFLAALRSAGTFGVVEHALDDAAHRLANS